MSYLYVDDCSANISTDDNYIIVTYKDGLIRKIPSETLESVQIFGTAHMTTGCTIKCIKNGIDVVYYSKGGKYFGRLSSTGHVNVERQRLQCKLYKSDFALGLSKKIISAKIHNQLVIMKRYERNSRVSLPENEKLLRIFEEKAYTAESIEQLMGIEGNAAKNYFNGLSKLVKDDFRFKGRSKRPPLDAFNSMLSLGYSIVMNEFYSKIVNKGLNPYFGFMHSDHEKHPTLASDLMEEWRAVIIDSLVMSLVNGNEISIDEFYRDTDGPGIYITNNGLKTYLKKYNSKVNTQVKYLDSNASPISFRRAMDIQIAKLVDAIEHMDYDKYEPLRVR